MPSNTLLNYINTELAKNISEGSIRTQCLAAGWPPAMINDAFTHLTSLKNGPNSQSALSLKKKSKLIPVIKLALGLLTIANIGNLVAMAATVLILQRAMDGAIKGALPFEFLTFQGWFYPITYLLIFVKASLCLRLFFTISSRTQKVWGSAIVSLVLLVIIEVTIMFLATNFIMPINNFSNSY